LQDDVKRVGWREVWYSIKYDVRIKEIGSDALEQNGAQRLELHEHNLGMQMRVCVCVCVCACVCARAPACQSHACLQRERTCLTGLSADTLFVRGLKAPMNSATNQIDKCPKKVRHHLIKFCHAAQVQLHSMEENIEHWTQCHTFEGCYLLLALQCCMFNTCIHRATSLLCEATLLLNAPSLKNTHAHTHAHTHTLPTCT